VLYEDAAVTLYEDEEVTDLNTLGGWTSNTPNINDLWKVVGSAETAAQEGL
jgi:hypothetical protein